MFRLLATTLSREKYLVLLKSVQERLTDTREGLCIGGMVRDPD